MRMLLVSPLQFLLCHFVGDYLLQTDWMALHKSRKTWNCLVHVAIYTACFAVVTLSWKALLFIFVTHFILDRFHIVLKKAIWYRNHLPLMQYPAWEYCNSTGWFDDSPYNTKPADAVTIAKFGKPRHFFITMWLYIIFDNLTHMVCNYFALAYLTS